MPVNWRSTAPDRCQNATFQTATLRQPLVIHSASLQLRQNSAQVQNLAASLAGTNATGAMTLRNFASPDVQFTLNADKINVTELQQALGSVPSNAPQPTRSSAWTLVPRAEAQTRTRSGGASPATDSILAKMTGNGEITAGEIRHDQLVLTKTHASVVLDHGIIRLSPLTAQLYGGQEAGTINVDTRVTPMLVQVNSQLQRVQANDLLSAVSSVKNTIYGLLNASTQTSFQAAPTSNDVARTLNGTLALDLSNGRIAKLDLMNQLAAIGKFAGLRQNGQAVTDFTRMSGHFNITNGVANTNDLRAEIANGSLAGEGSANLATQQLNMRLTAVLSKGFVQSAGATGIGGLMQTALANNRGELVIPVVVTGTFDHPQVSPDVQKVAQMRMQNLLPTSGNPGSMTTGILGSLLKGGNTGAQNSQQGGVAGMVNAVTGQQSKGQQGQQSIGSPQQAHPQAAPNQPGGAVNQVLQGIFGNKKQQPQK